MVNLSECICNTFQPVHIAIKNNKYTHFWLKGGRSSTKSTFIAVEIILGIINDHEANAACFRQVADTLADSCYSQLVWAINLLGVQDYFKCYKSPLTIEYVTGQRIYFRGLDDPTKIKSIRTKKGYIKYGWFEEITEMQGIEAIGNVCQSIIRGGNSFFVFYSYNPPKSNKAWVNKEALKQIPNRLVHHSTYLDVPKEWLGEQFLIEAEILKENNPQRYEHELMGIPNSTFDNLVVNGWSEKNIQPINYLKDLDLHITCDFNYSPNCWILAHKTHDKAFFFKEYCMDLRSKDLIKVVLDDYPHNGRIVINGDASGNRWSSNSDFSDYDAIKNELIRRGYREECREVQTGKRFSFETMLYNGSRKARFDAWNEKISNIHGEPEIYIDESNCPQLVMNMTELQVIPGTSDYQMPTKTELIKNPDLRFLGHPFDAASYLVNRYWAIRPIQEKKQATYQTVIESWNKQK